MSKMDPLQIRELLRRVPYPGFSKDIVAAGFVGEITTIGPRVEVEFKPNTRDDAKISEMEHAMRDLLLEASFLDVRIRRVNPFVTDAPLRSATDHSHHHHGADHAHHGASNGNGCGCESNGKSRLMTPLQAEYLEDGELPEDDLLAIALGRPDVAKAAGYGPGGPQPLAGPREDISYDCGIIVLQWDINPHNPQAKSCQHEIKLGEWDYRVWWQVHPSGLLYVSMQAMREDWVEHEGAVPHPIGRSEAVNPSTMKNAAPQWRFTGRSGISGRSSKHSAKPSPLKITNRVTARKSPKELSDEQERQRQRQQGVPLVPGNG